MKKNIFSLIVLFYCFLTYGENIKDPFQPLIIIEEKKEEKKEVEEKYVEFQEELLPPEIHIEGILWGTQKPLAIIDGEVYGVGDRLKGIDATVFKIEKNSVYILYNEKLFKMGTSKKEEK
jgi:type II secretory pathway component PulC